MPAGKTVQLTYKVKMPTALGETVTFPRGKVAEIAGCTSSFYAMSGVFRVGCIIFVIYELLYKTHYFVYPT